MNFKKKTLKNGLRVLVVPIKDAPSVTVMSMISTGSEYESKEKNGISHFLEHMFFKGTENRPKSIDIAKEFDGMGSEHNAFTSNEVTAYYGKASYKNFEKVLEIISDMYLNPTFPEAEMEKEKGVIIEEINMYEDLPQQTVQNVFQKMLYGDTPFGRDVLGPKENIKSMVREDFIKYRKSHYVAERTLVVVAGNVSSLDAFKKVGKAFKGILSGKIIKKEKIIENQSKSKIEIKHKKTDQSHIVIGVRTFGVHDKRLPILRVMSAVLGGGMSARLFQKMREELGICYYVRSSINDLTDHGNFTISAGVDKSRLDTAVSGILGELKKMSENLVGTAELKKAKDYLIGQMYLNLESSDSLAGFYGFQEILGQKLKKPNEVEKELLKVTPVQIKKLAKELFVDKSLNMAIVGNVNSKESLEKIFHF
ncbi:MAG: M16 family peptidase [Parcubacteria group bacterium Gr01-1014_46]|nr:MAG: M16 family peptidase [Parcubacteria group bacterium Gr01-1014_46]